MTPETEPPVDTSTTQGMNKTQVVAGSSSFGWRQTTQSGCQDPAARIAARRSST
jgi:hypothetical protein